MSLFARTIAVLALVGTALHDHVAWPDEGTSEPHARRAAVSGRASSIEYINYFIDDPKYIAMETSRARELAAPGEATRRKSLSREDQELFARTLLGECGRCSDAEVKAIGRVILNRLAAGKWGHTIGDVVTYNNRGVWAFSTWSPHQNRNEAIGSHVDTSKAFARMKLLADGLWQEPATDERRALGCYFYHPNSMKPKNRIPTWAVGRPFAQIGAGRFVRRC